MHFISLHSQEADPIAFTINGKPTYRSEVEKSYKKSNENTDIKLSIEDFTQSYIELKMNVEEAKAQHLDTTAQYINELEAYRSIIAKPYITDTISEKLYIKKMYDRLIENIEINHFLVPFDKDLIVPADTISVYNKALEIREKILKVGFKEYLLKKESNTTNYYLGMEGKNGYLGWVAPFILSPQLEDAVYSMPINEISMPIRTNNGFHIIQVLNKRKAIGSAEIEQVMFRFSRIPAPADHIDSVRAIAYKEYDHIKSSKDFQTLCDAFSEAYKTGDKGCYFGIVGLDSKLSPEFLAATFNLENPGDISQPVISDYGFHIIRLLRKIPVPSYEIMEKQLLEKVRSSNRVHHLNKIKRARLFERIQISIDREAFSKINKIAETLSPRDSLFTASIKNDNSTLMTIEEQREIPIKEFARYIDYRQNLLKKNADEIEMMSVSETLPYNLSTDILQEYFNIFMNIIALDFIEYTLEDNQPEAKQIMNEFAEGLLLYAVKDKNIWSRSKTDEEGLKKCFKENKAKYKLDNPKYKGVILYAKDEKSLAEAEKIAKREKTTDNIINKIRQKINKNSILVKIEPGVWENGENQYVDYKVYGGKEPKIIPDLPFFTVVGKEIKTPEDYIDVRTAVEADYQEELESNWNSYLKNKYKVTVNKSVIESIQ